MFVGPSIYMQNENRYEISIKSPMTLSAISREPINFFWTWIIQHWYENPGHNHKQTGVKLSPHTQSYSNSLKCIIIFSTCRDFIQYFLVLMSGAMVGTSLKPISRLFDLLGKLLHGIYVSFLAITMSIVNYPYLCVRRLPNRL